ncbi:methyl-accepting chemotaxis protein [Desulfacinum infernum DSM 9756]|uniref:Methyl-accepting chemotaxis protein n=1 Tax=Desulfacinum infernum DSM 9756 TaxID=1121391 RepID=A0A1M5I1R6_9BACT|nr:methyl-accepting chemotaxis protein [Desulfacinum infernum]SHG21963.1 methyl-accepting chemotaxis protein [Desulfacinum infernum DSM 9756]
MEKRWTVGRKLALSFTAVCAVVALLGGVGYFTAHQGAEALREVGRVRLPGVMSTQEMAQRLEAIKGSLRTLAISGLDPALRQSQYDNIVEARETYQAAMKVYELLPRTPEEAELWKRFREALQAWKQENDKAMEMAKKFDAMGINDPDEFKNEVSTFQADHYNLIISLYDLMLSGRSFEGGDDPEACRFGRWLSGFSSENPELKRIMTAVAEPHRRFHDGVRQMKQLVRSGRPEEARKVFDEGVRPAREETHRHMDAFAGVADEALATMHALEEQLLGPVTEKQRVAVSLLQKVVDINKDVGGMVTEKSIASAGRMQTVMTGVALAGLALAAILGGLVTRGINGVLRKSIEDLGESAEQVASAAGQVASASQQLAEGASEQAAGIEETSSAVEEMASMTRQNADNAAQADGLMRQAAEAAEQAKKSMGELLHSMEEISRSSAETQKIIKTIDEIAFQTNLLALNAAVEAARAGEAGAGFAVVADEVRNLAMRAAEAAKNTAQLIEGTVVRVKQGADLTGSTNRAFAMVHESVGKVAELVNEIAAASNEQSEGIGQVNTSISQMDRVVQQNAANAEESASAAEEMSAQAAQLRAYVEDLVALVGRRAKDGGLRGLRRRGGKAGSRPQSPTPRLGTAGSGNQAAKDRIHPSAPEKGTKTRPEELIPFDEDFQDF